MAMHPMRDIRSAPDRAGAGRECPQSVDDGKAGACSPSGASASDRLRPGAHRRGDARVKKPLRRSSCTLATLPTATARIVQRHVPPCDVPYRHCPRHGNAWLAVKGAITFVNCNSCQYRLITCSWVVNDIGQLPRRLRRQGQPGFMGNMPVPTITKQSSMIAVDADLPARTTAQLIDNPGSDVPGPICTARSPTTRTRLPFAPSPRPARSSGWNHDLVRITNDNTRVFIGTAEPNSTVTLFDTTLPALALTDGSARAADFTFA